MANDKDKDLKPGALTPGEEDKKGEDKGKESENKGKKKETIEVDAGLLKELIESNRKLSEQVDQLNSNAVAQTPNLQVRRKSQFRDYKLRKWNGSIVLGFENVGTDKRPVFVYNIYDKEARKDVQYVNLILKGKGKKEENKIEEKVDYLTFLRDSDVVLARKISEQKKQDVKEYGMIPKKEMAENGYGMIETMVMVPVEVVTDVYEMTLKLPDDEGGEEIVINSQWLNM